MNDESLRKYYICRLFSASLRGSSACWIYMLSCVFFSLVGYFTFWKDGSCLVVNGPAFGTHGLARLAVAPNWPSDAVVGWWVGAVPAGVNSSSTAMNANQDLACSAE
jgi:hypothetical protein